MPNFLVTTIKTTVNRIDYLIEDVDGMPTDSDDAYDHWNSYDTGFDIHKYEEDGSEGSEEVEYIYEVTNDFKWSEYEQSGYHDDYIRNHTD